MTVTFVVAVWLPAIAVTVTVYVPAGVPVAPPPPPPPPAARREIHQAHRERRDAQHIACPRRRTKRPHRQHGQQREQGEPQRTKHEPAPPPPFESGPAGIIAPAFRVTADVLAVVVTVNVVPLIVQLPSGMLQIAESVGVVVNPLVFKVNVNALPAPPDSAGCDGVTAAAAANVAVAVVFALIANVHTAFVLPAQAPAQFTNVAPEFGTAVSVIEVPLANEVPVGDCVIVPGPLTFVASV